MEITNTVETPLEIKFTSDIGVKLIQKVGGDHMVVAAAKVSTSGEDALEFATRSEDANYGLVNYLMKHRHGCYDDETEVLTNKGWKPWPSITGEEIFMTRNINSDHIEYQKATNVYHAQINDKMVSVKLSHVDILVTPDHKMFSSPRTNKADLAFNLYPASDFFNRSHRLSLSGGDWTAGTLHAPEEAAIVGFTAADGNVGDSVEFHLHKQRKINWLKSRISLSGSGNRFRLKDISKRLREWCKGTYAIDSATGNKHRCFPREIIETGDVETIRAMIDGYLEGDGSVSPTGKIQLSTISRQLANDLQESAVKAGYVIVEGKSLDKDSGHGFPNAKTLYRLSLYRDRNSYPRVGWSTKAREKEVKLVDYKGGIHCVTVPNGTLYVRRNGKPLWCGNSPFEHSLLTFFIHAPVFVWWEITRHRIGVSLNLESGRYKQLDPVFWIPRKERPMLRPITYKPARPVFELLEDEGLFDEFITDLKESHTLAYTKYKKYVDKRIGAEVARSILPFAIYYSGWMTCNPRSLMHFLSLRVHDDSAKYVSYPQLEIEESARAMEKILSEGWPLTYKSFIDNGRVAP